MYKKCLWISTGFQTKFTKCLHFARSSKISEARRVVEQTQIEPKHVYVRLEILSSTYLLVKSIQMDIFRQQIP